MAGLRGKKYSGVLYARAWGTNDAFRKMGNVSELTTSKESDSDELPSTGRDDYGEAMEVEAIPGATEASFKFNSFDKYALARALMGEAVDLPTTPESFTDVELIVGLDWIDIDGFDDIDVSTLVMKDATDTLVEKDTYELNERLGMIMFNETSTLTAGAVVKVTGTTKGSAGFQIDANTLTSLTLEIKLDGKDRITKKDGQLWIPHAVLTSDSDINWFSDDWWESGLSGKLVKDDNKPTMRFKEYS